MGRGILRFRWGISIPLTQRETTEFCWRGPGRRKRRRRDFSLPGKLQGKKRGKRDVLPGERRGRAVRKKKKEKIRILWEGENSKKEQ